MAAILLCGTLCDRVLQSIGEKLKLIINYISNLAWGVYSVNVISIMGRI